MGRYGNVATADANGFDLAQTGRPSSALSHEAPWRYHSGMVGYEPPEVLRARLQELRVEHRDLDEAIARLIGAPPADELMLRRLKKRKLHLKDRIALIERMLEPDVPA